MKHSSHASLSALALLLGTLTLVGCGGGFSMPDSSVTTPAAEVSGPPVKGSVFGGHAPIQGAHIYLLQPGITGYGSAATSLLNNNATPSGTVDASNGYPLSSNVNDPNVPATGGVEPMYVTTDSSGAFDLTGYYTCTANQPVYIYAYGGNTGPVSASTITETLNISAASVVHNTGTEYTYTFTYTAVGTPAIALAVGDPVALTLTGGGNAGGQHTWAGLKSVTVIKILSSTQFSATGSTDVTGTGSGTGTYTYPTPATPATNNNSIVQLATLGNCPGTGAANFGNGSNAAISYIYLNEVSTVATAYTFQPFTLLTNNDAWHIGTPNPATNALAATGIFNAAATAAQLYDIEGTQGSSTGPSDGEGHIANTQTIASGGYYTGNGVVPQATIDSLANILADCTDSVPAAVGSVPSQCSSLFNIATDNGITGGTAPTDTAAAAINIARFPAGNNSSTNVDPTYAADLYALQGSGTTPYQPQLNNAPNDWTIAINYPLNGIGTYTAANLYTGRPESIAVDGLGQIWITAQTDYAVSRYSSLGAPEYHYDGTYIWGYVAIDSSNNAWFGNAQYGPPNNTNPGQVDFGPGTPIDSLPPTAAGSTVPATHGAGYEEAYLTLPDGGGNIYFFAATAATGTDAGDHGYPYYQMFEMNSGGTVISSSTAACNGSTGTLNYYCISSAAGTSSINGGSYPAHGAIAAYTAPATPNFWLTTEVVAGGTTDRQIAEVTSTGTKVFSFEASQNNPEVPAVDNTGTAWIPDSDGQIYQVTPTATTPFYTSNILNSGTTRAALSQPFGAAVDGNGNIWITDRTNNTLIELNGTGTTTPGTAATAISPAANYIPEAQYGAAATTFTKILDQPLNIAIDPSGNIWMTNLSAGGFVEIVGAAAPTFTPLSVAAANNKLGAKP
jgi:hypothetical protein